MKKFFIVGVVFVAAFGLASLLAPASADEIGKPDSSGSHGKHCPGPKCGPCYVAVQGKHKCDWSCQPIPDCVP